jgi:hypothetical protein
MALVSIYAPVGSRGMMLRNIGFAVRAGNFALPGDRGRVRCWPGN